MSYVDTLIDDMALFHDGPVRTLQYIPTWGSGWNYPESYAKPDGWTTCGPWGVIMSDYSGAGTRPWRVQGPYTGNTAGNTRAQVRDMQLWWLRSDGVWQLGSHNVTPGGYMYLSSWQGETYTTNNAIRAESDGNGGGRSCQYINMNGPNPPQYQFNEWHWHFFGSRANVPANYIGFATCFFARKILHDPGGPDDRANARLLADTAGDWWITPTAQWDNFTTNWPIGYNRFKYLTNDWQLISFYSKSTLSAAQIRANPPPFIGLSILSTVEEPDPEPDPPPAPLALPSRGNWFPLLTSAMNTWTTHAVSNTATNKLRRRRGVKLWS